MPIWTSCASVRQRLKNFLRIPIVLVLTGSAMLLPGCQLPRQVALPDQSIPHRVATETIVDVWVRRPDGQLVVERVRLMPGWWLASPMVVERN